MVMQLPEADRYSMSYKWMISRLAIMMGGRVAEELKFGKENITSGASSDIQQATKLAKAMVTEWGYSDDLGQVNYSGDQTQNYLGMGGSMGTTSEATAQIIDSEVRRLVDTAYADATKILKKKKKDWETLSQGLLEYETLSGDEIADLLKGKPPNRDEDAGKPPSRGSAVPTAGAKKKGGEPDSGDMEPQPS